MLMFPGGGGLFGMCQKNWTCCWMFWGIVCKFNLVVEFCAGGYSVVILVLTVFHMDQFLLDRGSVLALEGPYPACFTCFLLNT